MTLKIFVHNSLSRKFLGQVNYFINVIKSKLAFGEYQDILDLVNMNLAFRKGLTRTLMNQSNRTDKELYANLKNNDHVIEDLDNLNVTYM